MLDRSKLTKQLELVVKYSFDAISQELEVAKKLWKKINEDSYFVDKAQKACKSLGLPDWNGALNAKSKMDIEPVAYTVVSVDGSQKNSQKKTKKKKNFFFYFLINNLFFFYYFFIFFC